MDTFRLVNGDLVIGAGGFETISGAAKVVQDLGVAVREPYGADRFNPRWGSLLRRQIGQPINEETALLITSEVRRVVQNYATIQNAVIQDDMAARRPVRYGTNELVVGVAGVVVETQADTLRVRATISTLSGDQLSLTTEAKD